MIGESEMNEYQDHVVAIDMAFIDTIKNLRFILSLTEQDLANRQSDSAEIVDLAYQLDNIMLQIGG